MLYRLCRQSNGGTDFESVTLEADDETQATCMEDEIAKDKGLSGDHEFEIVDLTAKARSEEEAKAAENPTEPEVR